VRKIIFVNISVLQPADKLRVGEQPFIILNKKCCSNSLLNCKVYFLKELLVSTSISRLSRLVSLKGVLLSIYFSVFAAEIRNQNEKLH